jgi:hypothetical protein
MKLVCNNEAMEAEVSKYLSVGMPVENAKRIMEDSGFKCEESHFDGPPHVICSAVLTTQHLSILDNITVRLYHDAGKVTAIKAECHSVGP